MEQKQLNNQTEINPEHVINSLASQIADLSIKSSNKDAVIISQRQKIMELEEKMEELRKEVGNKEKGGEKNGNNK